MLYDQEHNLPVYNNRLGGVKPGHHRSKHIFPTSQTLKDGGTFILLRMPRFSFVMLYGPKGVTRVNTDFLGPLCDVTQRRCDQTKVLK